MVDIRQPRNQGMPSFEAMKDPVTAYRFLEMLYQRSGATQDQPFEDHMMGRDNQADIEQLKDDIRRVREDTVTAAEDVRGETLNEIGRVLDGLETRVRELEERPIISDILDELFGRINDVAANTQQTETGLRDLIEELVNRIETLAIDQSTVEQTVPFATVSQFSLAVVEGGTAGLMAYSGAGNDLTARTLTVSGDGLSVANGTGAGGNPTISLANDLAALEALSGTNNIYYRSAANTWSPVTFGTGLAFAGGAITPANDLAALEGLTGTNTIYYRSGASTWTAVTIGRGLSFSGGTLNGPLAVGIIGDAGFVFAASENVASVSRTATGTYEVSLTTGPGGANFPVVVTAQGSGLAASVSSLSSSAPHFVVNIFDTAGTATNAAFQFIVYPV